ncbi:MAG: SDR family oxidoreductase [Planctomycetota bacterium]
MDLEIREKVALVAAASKGLGRAVAAGLAREGARVAVCARHGDVLEQTARDIEQDTGAEVLSVVADVAVAADCERFVSAALERWGRIDILVNNSGGPTPGKFDALDDAEWLKAVDSTLMNVVRLTRLVIPHMQARQWGRIVNIESISVKQPIDVLLLSNSLRPAVIGLAKSLATELAPHGILINNVLPGKHETDRLRELAEIRAQKNKTDCARELIKMAETIPLKRLGQPAELADVVVFLCSARASYVTGTTLLVDGGAYRGLM